MAKSNAKIPLFAREEIKTSFALTVSEAIRAGLTTKSNIARVAGVTERAVDNWFTGSSDNLPGLETALRVIEHVDGWPRFIGLLRLSDTGILDNIAVAEASLQGVRARLNEHPPTIELQEAVHRLGRLISLAGDLVGEMSRASEQRVPRVVGE